jgi:hypothetical protein
MHSVMLAGTRRQRIHWRLIDGNDADFVIPGETDRCVHGPCSKASEA